MTSIADSSVSIQTSAELAPCPPPWFGEVVLLIAHLKTQGVLAKLCERVQFARRRFGLYEVIDVVAVLFGYAISGERTLQVFYETLLPWAEPFMALSRFLAALTETPVEALHTLFYGKLIADPLDQGAIARAKLTLVMEEKAAGERLHTPHGSTA